MRDKLRFTAHNLCLYRTTPESTKVQQSFHLFPALFSLLLPPSFCAVACALFPSLLFHCPVDFCQFICWLSAVADVPCLYFKNVSAPQSEKGRERETTLPFRLAFCFFLFRHCHAPLCSIEWIIIDGTTSLGCRQQAQGADKAGRKPQTQLFYATCHFWQPTCEESTKRRRGNKPKKNCRQIFL